MALIEYTLQKIVQWVQQIACEANLIGETNDTTSGIKLCVINFLKQNRLIETIKLTTKTKQ